MVREREKNMQSRQEFRLSDKEPGTNRKLNSSTKENSEKATTTKRN